MSLLGRIFADDEDFGKKSDDRKPKKPNILPSWSTRTTASSAPAYRRKSVLYALIACIVLYFFFLNIPEPTNPPTKRPQYIKPSPHAPQNPNQPKAIPETPTQKPPRPEKPSEAEQHYYDGPIKFYNLAVSLRGIAWLRGQIEYNRNVLFVASNLRSASELIPIACEMASWEKADVHFALMGRDDLEMDEMKTLNGVDEWCNVNWHDARPDFSFWSSDFRMEVSVSAALGHIQTFMHPQVVITDDAGREDGFFTKAIRAKAFEMGKTVIELPKDSSENLMWITRLDSASLAAWHNTYVDILIHAPPDSSGSLLRLLKSIEAADYFGHRRPHLTIELPADIDPPTWAYLKQLTWPPLDWSGAPHASQVTLRHRVPRTSDGPEEATLRHVESFYPTRPAHSHVLVLSPQVELSPLYFHFLMYHLLEYKHSQTTSQFPQMQSLMGLSLELPYMHLNDTTGFSPPTAVGKSKDDDTKSSPAFLWQAPNSNAALYFGDKWIEFHSFLTSRIARDPTKQPGRRKSISEIYPAWLEYLQELMRARGYTLLYPNFASSSTSSNRNTIATLHYELYHPPEEFSNPKSTSKTDAPMPTLDPKTETLTADPNAHHPKHKESKPLTSNLNSLLPPRSAGNFIQDPSELPLLSHEGNEIDLSILEDSAYAFAGEFRRQVGLCPASYSPTVAPMKANDLFCDPDADVSNPDEPVVQDGDVLRQSEFEAHLNRQGGVKGDEKAGEESSGEGSGKNTEGPGKGKGKGKGKDMDEKEADQKDKAKVGKEDKGSRREDEKAIKNTNANAEKTKEEKGGGRDGKEDGSKKAETTTTEITEEKPR
ncbi:MAG: hypothetical protein Q9216_005504, partial [Gyalolechia sp. 2 TL-2023]